MTPIENEGQTVIFKRPATSLEEIQHDWHELTLKIQELQSSRDSLEKENKSLRTLVERVIDHRKKSHCELVMILSGFVARLPMNDLGVVIAKLVEHNAAVADICSQLAKGKMDAAMPQPALLRALDESRCGLAESLKSSVEELIKLETPLDTAMLKGFAENPDSFYAPAATRANRCFVKGQLPRERVVCEFGEDALVFFNDLTTDAKLNPRPKPEEIVMAFKPDFDKVAAENPASSPEKRESLRALHAKVLRNRGTGPEARAQKIAFAKLSFCIGLRHYYDNQNTEAPDVVFAQRMPALVEHIAVTGPAEKLDVKMIEQMQALLKFIISNDHRHMLVNNVGKNGGAAGTLRFLLTARSGIIPEPEAFFAAFARHISKTPDLPNPKAMAEALRLTSGDAQLQVVRAIRHIERLSKQEAEALCKSLAGELGLKDFEDSAKANPALTPEQSRHAAWVSIRDLIAGKAEPSAVVAAVRERLHAHYDADELKESWLALVESEAITFIRVVCQFPYLPDGKQDAIAQPVLESYMSRLTHEKYAATYAKVVATLKNLAKANARGPTLLNFIALVKWVDAAAAEKLSADVGV